MLAQNFLTADALGITKLEHDALVRVLGMLERQECDGFDMQQVWHGCCSPSCILGWARHVARKIDLFPRAVLSGDHTERLFFPGHVPAAFKAGQSTAALALRNYLTVGEPRWAEVLAAR